jgi:anti-sigma factor ChrR (cupin superfamily)
MKTPVIKKNKETPWVPLAPGIEMQIFYADPPSGVWTVKILMHGGSTLPPHRHIGASEFYIIEGEGVHKESGAFEVGTYAFEPENALHSSVHAGDDIVLYMTSYGAGVFLTKSGKRLYEGNAEYFKSQMELGPFGRAMKRFFLITVWSLFKGKKAA